MAMTPEFAWAVGLFEGEGCVSVTRSGMSNPYLYMRMFLGMVDEDVVQRFQEIVGVGYIRPRVAPGRKTLHCWLLRKQDDVEVLLNQMWPLLSERRREIIQVHRATCAATRLTKAV